VGETLISTKFPLTTTRGFGGANDPEIAICLRPGTEIAFERDALTEGMVLRKNIGHRLARFRQIDLDKPARHHDALEFANGTIVMVTDLVPGQKATVLQLPTESAATSDGLEQSKLEAAV
jgi:hypothetical protein